MIEVFKTDVKDGHHANMLVDAIHNTFTKYIANFDLEDRDKILRIKCISGYIQASFVIELLKDFGFTAEILPDTIISAAARSTKGTRDHEGHYVL